MSVKKTKIYFILFLVLFLLAPKAYSINLKLEITGLNAELKKNLLESLKIYKALNEPKLNDARIANLHNSAIQQIREFAYSNGYYNAEITPELLHNNDVYLARYNIKLNQAVIIKNVDLKITGDLLNNKRAMKLLKATPLQLKTGTTFTHKNYEETKELLLSKLLEFGFLSAKYTRHEVLIDQKTNQADIYLDLKSGPQYLFGTVEFQGSYYNKDLLQRYLPFKYKDAYNTHTIEKTLKSFYASDLFAKVKFEPIIDLDNADNNIVPIKILLEDKPYNKYSGSLGYGTDTGPRFSIGWYNRAITDTGHRLGTNASINKIKKDVAMNYIIAGKKPSTDRYIYGGKLAEEKLLNRYDKYADLHFNKLYTHNRLQYNWELRYFTETFRIYKALPKENKKFLMPALNITWTKLKLDQMKPNLKLALTIRGALKSFASNKLMQSEFTANAKIPVTDSVDFTFLGNVGLSYCSTINDLPLSLRYFAGGDHSVRGFRYKSLGPTATYQGETYVTGGKHIIVFNTELSRLIYEDIGIAVFLDAGNSTNKLDFNKLAFGSGVGARWKTPIGSFKFDVAKPLNYKFDQKHIRFHISFDTDF